MANSKIEVKQSDITKMEVDAVVNAANSSLKGGGGVDGAIHRAGGKVIYDECMQIIEKIGSLDTGEAVITSAGKMPAKYVIHTVGPVYRDGSKGEPEKLANAYRNSLKVAAENNCKTVAFPNISTGIYRFPKKEAAKIATETVQQFLEENQSIEKVYLVCFDEENYHLAKEFLQE